MSKRFYPYFFIPTDPAHEQDLPAQPELPGAWKARGMRDQERRQGRQDHPEPHPERPADRVVQGWQRT